MRPRSLFLNLEGVPDEATVDGPSVLRKVIYNSLKDGGIDMQTIEGIECFSKTQWYVVFKRRMDVSNAKNKEIEVHGKTYVLLSTEFERQRINYTWVRLYGYPLDSDSTFLRTTMASYGDLVSIVDEMDGRLQIKTGVKLAQYSSLKGNIPSFIHVGRFRVRTAYRGQVRTCRNCHKEGHEVKDCKAGRVCKQCGEPGHTKGECPERICFQCHGKGHEVLECPEYARAFPRVGEEPPIETNDTENEELHLTARDTWVTAREREETMHVDVATPPVTREGEQQPEPTSTPNNNDTSATPNTLPVPSTDPPSPEVPDQTRSNDTVDMEASTSTTRTPTLPQTETRENDGEPPALPPDSTDSSSEEEPPLKTLKTVTPSTDHPSDKEKSKQPTETTGKTTMAKAGSRKKKKKGKSPAVNIATGKNRNPFTS